MERLIESTMYTSRWLLASIYLGLSLAVFLLGIKFFQEVAHIFPLIFSMKETDLVLVTLSLVDMTLVGGLLVMVMLSGYKNFVSAIDLKEGQEKLAWLWLTQAKSGRFHCCHLVHSPVKSIYGRATNRQ
jgi:uncharacterized protein (TIGR00645 family)